MAIHPALFLIPVVGGILAFAASKSAKAKPAAPGAAGPVLGQPVLGQPIPGQPIPGQPIPGPPVQSPPGVVFGPPPFAAAPGAPVTTPPFFPAPPGRAPRDWQSEVAAAVASRDSARLRQLATEMEASGAAAAAAVVRNYAQVLDSAGAVVPPPFTTQPPGPRPVQTTPVVFQPAPPAPAPPATPPPQVVVNPPPISIPVPQPPALPIPIAPPSPFPGGVDRNFAEATNNHLLSHTRFKENRLKVGAFQVKEGLKNDGLYGTGTAGAIAKYGIIPAKPYYYPKKNAAAKKAAYKSLMARYAELDPARRAAWLEAARIDHL